MVCFILFWSAIREPGEDVVTEARLSPRRTTRSIRIPLRAARARRGVWRRELGSTEGFPFARVPFRHDEEGQAPSGPSMPFAYTEVIGAHCHVHGPRPTSGGPRRLTWVCRHEGKVEDGGRTNGR